MYYSEEVIEEVRTKNDIVDVISGYVRLQKKGSSYFGLCPFHNEKSPSFSVSREKQMYYCFGCGAGGNVFTFLMDYENFSFVEALKFLADRAGVVLPEMEYSKEAKARADRKTQLLEINKLAAQYFYVQLKSEQGKMFPIMDVNNRVIGFGGRVMGDAKPKYLNSPETEIFDKSRNLYGLNRARTSRKPYFLVCEGYMDVIALHQAGFTNAVASLGTALTTGHAALIKRYVQEVYLTYDSDEAGTRAALRAVPILKEAGITAKVIRMDPYKDPDEFIKNLGAEEFERRIGNARNGFMFGLEMLEKEYDMNSPEGKTAFFQEAARRLIGFEDELERNNYIEAVAGTYRATVESLQKLVAKTAVREGMAKPVERPKQATGSEKPKEDGVKISQKILLTWMIEDRRLFGIIQKYISPEDFPEPLYHTVAEFLYHQYEEGELNPAKILNHFTKEEEHREAASLFHTKIQKLTTKEEREKALQETIVKVKTHSIDYRTMHLEPTDIIGLQKLMEEKRKLDDLKKLHISIE